MKTRSCFLLACFVTLVFLAAGCGGKGVPVWVTKPPELTAVGVSPVTHDPAIMYEQSELNARNGLGRILSYKVKGVLRRWATSRREVYSKEPIDESYFESINTGLTAIDLPNVRIKEYYLDKEKKRFYALAVLDYEMVLPNIKEVVRKETEKHLLFDAEEDAEAAFRELDKALEDAALE